MTVSEAKLSFHRLIPQARMPQRADRSASGTIPTRAYRYCDAVTSASGFGWWIFPPTDFQLIWNGTDVFWHFEGAPDWLPLAPAAQFPDFARAFDQMAPAELQGCAPPFLTALPEPGVVQIWTGLMARTAPGWSLLIRPPANMPVPGGYCLYEGIVETDFWFGPLFTNLRLTQTNRPVRLRSDFPLLQVQPLPRIAYDDQTMGATTINPDMSGMSDSDWSAYRDTVAVPSLDKERAFGAYAVAVRKRRKGVCPFSGARTPSSAAAAA
ncbi:MAG TPA: DUF6065 family protein [Rhodopila sp.]|nr:DUF6065 family protein [Rhodopila sp.]